MLDLYMNFSPIPILKCVGDTSPYNVFKQLTVGRSIPSQVIFHRTTEKSYTRNNIIRGILGKTGNIPYVLAHPLAYTDYVVGIDIARERKKRLAGTINSAAIARIYFNNGEILRYGLHDALIEGETIPASTLQALFPKKEFEGKRVLMHRDGFFRGNESEVLLNWGEQIGAKFNLVEVIKSGSPRLYQWQTGRIGQPKKGTSFVFNEKQAFMVSSLPPFPNSTPNPLHIRTHEQFPLKSALHSVLTLTLLHYGSELEPRLPVSVHYSDKIAGMALKGIKPRELEGNIPYWL